MPGVRWSGIADAAFRLHVSLRSAAVLLAATASVAADEPARLRSYEQHALTHTGDVARGRALFLDPQRTKCGVCHRIGDAGGEVGPNLTSIGGKFDRPHLIESLLEPSRQIVEGYRSSVLTLTDGRVVTGIVRPGDGGRVTVRDASDRVAAIPASDVESRADSDVSLMPDGLAKSLSLDEFTDLIAYLESLRTGEQKMGAQTAGAIRLPEGFEVRTLATGLSGATALETTPDGRVLVCEQTGALRVIRDGRLLPEPFVTLPVEAHWERGLIGVTVAPDFPASRWVYVCYVTPQPYMHHVVSRFQADGDVARPGSEEILLSGDDQAMLGGKTPAGHQGGALHFGPDGKLYVAIGDQTAEAPAQRLDTLQGKLLRLNADGSIPQDNPFVRETTGKYRSIWALGCRNPYTFSFSPPTGELLINDVGGKFEEINPGRAGANYGWPVREHGVAADDRYTGARYSYPQSSICGGDFVPPGRGWPVEWEGQYLFADFVHGWIHALDAAGGVREFAAGLRRPVDLRFDCDGRLLVLLRNAWVIDGKFQPGTSSVLSIRPPPGLSSAFKQ